MKEKTDQSLKTIATGEADEVPEVYAVRHELDGNGVRRRAFVTALGVGAAASCNRAALQPQPASNVLPPVDAGSCQELLAHSGNVRSVAFSPDGQQLATAGGDEIKLWSVPGGKLLQTFTDDEVGVSALAFRPDGKVLASGNGEGWVKLWGVNPGGITETPQAFRWLDAVTCIAFSPDGKSFAAGGAGGALRFWDIPARRISTLDGHTDEVRAVAFSPQSDLFASCGYDGTVRLWDTHGTLVGSVVIEGERVLLESVTFATNQRVVAAGGYGTNVSFIDLPEFEVRKTLETPSSFDGVMSLAASPGGSVFAAAMEDGKIQLWSLPHGDSVRVLSGHPHPVNSVALSLDGKLLASGSGDGSVRLWSMTSGEASCLVDEDIIQAGSQASKFRQMGPRTITQPCDAPKPAGAVCVCDCVATSRGYRLPETICICDTVMVPAGAALPAGAVCVCNTVSVGTLEPPPPPPPAESPSTPSFGGHYWYPN